jgi:hypothetical protein
MDPSAENKPLPAKAGKRVHEPPKLVEYGSVAKLTQGALTTQGDGVGGFKKACL